MRRIPRAFERDPKTGLLTPRPLFDWFVEGKGIASRKFDGLPLLIQQDPDGAVGPYRGFTGAEEPTPQYGAFIRTSDADDPEVRGWVPISGQVAEDQPFVSGILLMQQWGRPLEEMLGTYELVGPEIKGNPERVPSTQLWKHERVCYIHCPRTFEGVLMFLAAHPEGEGIIWRWGDQYCQVTRSDVGLPWPAREPT